MQVGGVSCTRIRPELDANSVMQSKGKATSSAPICWVLADASIVAGLLETVLQPSSLKIHPDYAMTIVATQSGKVFTGIVRPISDTEIEIAINETQKIRLSVNEIEDRKSSPVSLMTAGLHKNISPSEMADLLAYLSEFRSTVAGTLQDALATLEKFHVQLGPSGFKQSLGADLRRSSRRPVWFGALPGVAGSNVVLELERGRVWRGDCRAKGIRQNAVSSSMSAKKSPVAKSLVCWSIAFHPDFVHNRAAHFLKIFAKVREPDDSSLSVHIIERKATDDGLRDSGEPSKLLLKIPVFSEVHNGGDLAFGPDGYLYLGMGDTGPQEDPRGHGQNLSVLWGKILRIDVDHTDTELAYAIPADNPFRDRPGARPEIWAFGFREPLRISFDSKTGDLWVGDVGQNRFEEVAIVRAGENHGWNVFEGFQNHSDRFSSKDSQYVPPIFAYNHAVGPSVTGGFVYRGSRVPSLAGDYVFGDFETRRVWALKQRDRKVISIVEIGRAPERIVSFGLDAQKVRSILSALIRG